MKTATATIALALLMCCSAFAQNSACDYWTHGAQYSNESSALLTRLLADYQHAQNWESVDADHPDAVKVRGKSAREELELKSKTAEEQAHDKEYAGDPETLHEMIVKARATCPDIMDTWKETAKE